MMTTNRGNIPEYERGEEEQERWQYSASSLKPVKQEATNDSRETQPARQPMQKKRQQKRKSIDEKEEKEEPVRVEMPTELDILCGQSRVCASHGGNKRFSAVLDEWAERYDAATSKQEKMTMTKEIVAVLKARGRFLKCKDGMWEEISTVAARDKVSHALRTRVASWKRQQQQLLEGHMFSPAGRHRNSMPTSRRKSKHRKEGRRSSAPSIAANNFGRKTSSFDVNDPTSAAVVSNLMKAQQEIFASLTSPHRDGRDGCEPYPIEHLEPVSHADDLARIFEDNREFDNEFMV